MLPKLVVVLSVFLVIAAQAAVRPKLGFHLPNLRLIRPGFDSGRIVGGKDAVSGEFPHQVSLQWGLPPLVDYQHFCGGSIINSSWVLTAGHCVKAVPAIGNFVIKAGKLSLKTKEAGEQTIKVKDSIIHENYTGGVAPFDVALLKLEKPLTLSKNVSAINLPKPAAKPSGTSTLSGWGSTGPNGNVLPDILQKADLPIIDLATCKEKMEAITGPTPLHETNVCTGSTNDQDSACSGDSGGPLILKNNSTGVSELIGVVSWGTLPCGYKGSPSVYGDVAQFVDWIQATMAKN